MKTEIHLGSIWKYRTLYLCFNYISGNEIVCENEVGVHFRTVYNKDNMFIFSFFVSLA